MSWYNDPEVGPPPATPAPPAPPQVPPGGPTGQPAGQGGDGGQGGVGSLLGNTRLVLAVGAVAVVVTLVVGFVGYRVVFGPTEMTDREYTRALCDDVLEPAAKEIEDISDSRDFERIVNMDVNSESDARKAVDAAKRFVEATNSAFRSTHSFSGSNRLKGSDGEDLHSEIDEGMQDWRDLFDEVMRDLNDIDPKDEEDVVEDIQKAFGDLEGLDLSVREGDPAYELMSRTYDVDEDCGNMFAMVAGSATGE